MPNWIEGTMKVRGKAENLMRLFENAFETLDNGTYRADKDIYSESVDYNIKSSLYIEGSRRAFTSQSFNVYVDFNEYQTVSFPVKQAWSWTPEEGSEQRWINLAKKYGVDIRLQGFECGMQFYQDLEIVNGEIVTDNVVQYDDWEWECPMPNLGG